MEKSDDLTGQRFGQLTVQKKVKGGWLCLCDCGKETIAHGCHLKNGRWRSCGCLRYKHGMTDTRLYQIWHGMKDRCQRKDGQHFEKYGGRGITVCQEWADSFEAFKDWALANGYRDDLSLDRKDNDGPYSPDNCRWATRREQQSNRKITVFITHNGETRTLAEWSRITGIHYATLSHRLRRGYPEEKLFSIEDNRKKKGKKL